MRRINPSVSYRVTMDEIRQSYENAAAAFDAGDFNLAAADSPDGSEIQGMALILTGMTPKGGEILDAVPLLSPLGRVCRAFGAWYEDDVERALAELARVPDSDPNAELAAHLRALIEKPVVNVACIAAAPNLPMLGLDGPDLYHEPVFDVGGFRIRNVAAQPPNGAYSYRHDESFSEFLDSLPDDEQPDFVIALVCQWLTPKDLEKVSVPKILWMHDHDLFIHRFYDNFFAYDVKICCTSQEHFEVREIFGGCVVTHHYSDIFGVPFSTPKGPARPDKDVDIVMTGGGTLDPFFRDKSSFAFCLATRLRDDRRLVVVNGHLPRDEYLDLASRAKSMPIPSRMCGNPSPRWRDPLLRGALLIHPEGTLFDKLAIGAVPHRNDMDFPEDFKRTLDAFDDGSLGVSPDDIVADATTRFAFNAVSRDKRMERFFRLAAFMGAWSQCRLVRTPTEETTRKLLVWPCPGLDVALFGFGPMISRMSHLSSAVAARADFSPAERLAAAGAEMAQAVIVGHSHGLDPATCAPIAADAMLVPSDSFIEDRFARALELLDADGGGRADLISRFNALYWPFYLQQLILKKHPGRADLVKRYLPDLFEAIPVAVDLFVEESTSLRFNPLGADVGLMSLHEHDTLFPYWDYGSLATLYAMRRNGRSPQDRADLDSRMRGLLRGVALGVKGDLLTQRGAHVDALDAYRAAFDAYRDNPHVARRKTAILLERVQAAAATESERDELLEAYFQAGSLDPAYFLAHVPDICEVLQAAGRKDELRRLVSDWYFFARCIHDRQIGAPIIKDVYYYTRMNRFSDYFPDELKTLLAARRSNLQKGGLFGHFEAQLAPSLIRRLFGPGGGLARMAHRVLGR